MCQIPQGQRGKHRKYLGVCAWFQRCPLCAPSDNLPVHNTAVQHSSRTAGNEAGAVVLLYQKAVSRSICCVGGYFVWGTQPFNHYTG